MFDDTLYKRLDVVTLSVPPLRRRVDEILPLALRFLQQANQANGRAVKDIAPATQGEAEVTPDLDRLRLDPLDGDGRDEIVLCQGKTLDSFTTESLIYRGAPDGIDSVPVRLVSDDARRVFVVRASNSARPQVVLINHFSRGVCGDVDVTIYHGGPDGFSTTRKTGMPGFGALLCAEDIELIVKYERSL